MKTPREILKKFLEDVKQNVRDNYPLHRNKGTNEYEINIQKEIDQALSALRELVLGEKKENIEICVIKQDDGKGNMIPVGVYEKNDKNYEWGYNQALQDIANLFGGEK